MKVYVFFTNRDTLLSKIISKVTNCKYTHVGFIINQTVYDCQKKGVEKHQIKDWFNVNKTYTKIDLYEIEMYIDTNRLIRLCEENKNKKYDKISLLNHLLQAYFNFWIKRKTPENVFTCSEFVGYVLYILTKNIKFINNYKMSPKDLFETKKFKYSHTINYNDYN